MKRNRLLLLMLLYSTGVIGQISQPFTIGGMFFKDTTVAQINYTFVDNGKCLLLSNGLNLFPVRKDISKFSPVCVETGSYKPCPLIAFPNPTKDFSTIQTSGCYNTYVWLKGKMTLVTELGQVIQVREILIDDLRKGVIVDLREFAAGVYFVNITFQNVKQNLKIIKSHG